MNESQRRRRLAAAANDTYDDLMHQIGAALQKMTDEQRITAMVSTVGMVICLAAPTQEDAGNLVGCLAEDIREFIETRWSFFEGHKLEQAKRSMGERAMAEAMAAEGMTEPW